MLLYTKQNNLEVSDVKSSSDNPTYATYLLGLKRFKDFNSIQYDSIFIKKFSIRFKSIRFLRRFFLFIRCIQKILVTKCFNISIKDLFYYLFKLIAVQTMTIKELACHPGDIK